ncbi:uncharacterized protein LOC130665881 [Microplitis mediator]|uniref:uncharacterized protein LOC130665881 n=1 Tax=Microplitis mediator TaxID=375433 RepID=UPI002556572A|nr:uncharacterized protein LOC130665881 [Microplitis mediator]
MLKSPLWDSKIVLGTSAMLKSPLWDSKIVLGNGLGSHAGVHKLSGTYISIPCLPPHFQTLNSIFHAVIYSSKDRQEFGNYAVYRTLIEELRFLDKHGVELDLPQGKTKIYFKLGLILGDNLGLHSILGFVENFNASYSCRFCKMDKIQRSLATVEDKSLIRSYQYYKYDLNLKDPNSTGIKKKCVFSSLPDFHVTQNYAVDMMHDFLRGIFHFDMIEIINHYIYKAKLFSLDELSSRMNAHDFRVVESKNKPPEILDKHLQTDSLKMSAGETLTFIRHFGIIVGDMIPEDDIVWRVYLNLRQILDIISSRSLQKESKFLLDNLVSEHHILVQRVLKRKLKAKDHILLHYGSVFIESGPVINTSSMRFEANHQGSLKMLVPRG